MNQKKSKAIRKMSYHEFHNQKERPRVGFTAVHRRLKKLYLQKKLKLAIAKKEVE